MILKLLASFYFCEATSQTGGDDDWLSGHWPDGQDKNRCSFFVLSLKQGKI